MCLNVLKTFRQAGAMAFEEIKEQTDVVAAGIVVAAMREQGLDQFFGGLLGVIAESFVVDGWVIDQLVDHSKILSGLVQQKPGLLRGSHAAQAPHGLP